MTDKERLEEIEKNLDPLGYGMGGHLISVNDIYWLVKYAKEQAERVQELEEELVKYRNSFELQLLINNNIKNQIKRYREALEEIRNHGTYELNNALKTDYGWIAHEALEGESNE